MTPAMIAPMPTPTIIGPALQRPREVCAAASEPSFDKACASSHSRAAVAASDRRLRRSFSRHRLSTLRMPAGTSGGSARQSGSSFSTDAIACETVSPSNARRPVSISNRTAPNAHRSVRRSTGRPAACSGLMYAAVPRITPAAVICAGEVIVGDVAPPADETTESIAFARPKSRTFTSPSGRSLMFAGFRSR
jgi:hypothetical protein